MQQEILLWCIAAPILATSIAAGVLIGIGRFGEDRPSYSSPQAGIAVIAWCAAIAIALVGRQSPGWWPDEAWQRVLWPIAIASLAIACCIRDDPSWRDRRWLCAGLGAMATGMLAMPNGEGWSELFHLHRTWSFAVAASGLVNIWMLDSLARRRAERWVSGIAVAGLGGPMLLAAANYGGLAEWVLAAIAATAVMAIGAALAPATRMWAVLYPSCLFAAAATAAVRFYTYEEYSPWLYAVALLLPSIIAALDFPLGNRSTATRVAVAVALALGLLGAIAWTVYGDSWAAAAAS